MSEEKKSRRNRKYIFGQENRFEFINGLKQKYEIEERLYSRIMHYQNDVLELIKSLDQLRSFPFVSVDKRPYFPFPGMLMFQIDEGEELYILEGRVDGNFVKMRIGWNSICM